MKDLKLQFESAQQVRPEVGTWKKQTEANPDEIPEHSKICEICGK